MEDFKNSKEAQEKYHDWEVSNGYARRHTDALYSQLKNLNKIKFNFNHNHY